MLSVITTISLMSLARVSITASSTIPGRNIDDRRIDLVLRACLLQGVVHRHPMNLFAFFPGGNPGVATGVP